MKSIGFFIKTSFRCFLLRFSNQVNRSSIPTSSQNFSINDMFQGKSFHSQNNETWALHSEHIIFINKFLFQSYNTPPHTCYFQHTPFNHSTTTLFKSNPKSSQTSFKLPKYQTHIFLTLPNNITSLIKLSTKSLNLKFFSNECFINAFVINFKWKK